MILFLPTITITLNPAYKYSWVLSCGPSSGETKGTELFYKKGNWDIKLLSEHRRKFTLNLGFNYKFCDPLACTGLVTVLLSFFTLSTFPTKTGQPDCNTNFGSSTLSTNADPEPVAFSSYMTQSLKHPYNLYTVLTCINHILCICTWFFSI